MDDDGRSLTNTANRGPQKNRKEFHKKVSLFVGIFCFEECFHDLLKVWQSVGLFTNLFDKFSALCHIV